MINQSKFSANLHAMVITKYIFFLVLILHSLPVVAQRPVYFIQKGDEFALSGAWDLAYSYYNEAYKMDTTDFQTTAKLADAARMVKQYKFAHELYERNYEKDNGKLEPDALFRIATLQKSFGRYEDAQRNFKKYLKKHKSTGNKVLLERAAQEVKSAVWALNYKARVDSVSVIAMPPEINSEMSELLSFGRGRFVFATTSPGGKWTLMEYDSLRGVKSFDLPAKNEEDEIANFFEYEDGAVVAIRRDGRTAIYRMENRNNELVEFPQVNEQGSINTMPCMTRIDGVNTMFWASDRSGGEGGMDIWKCELAKDGSPSKIVNAGKMINTPGDELFPFFQNDELYFCSDWHEGFGGQDIFSCKRFGDTWDKPVNMGSQINSSWNDLSFIMDEKSQNAFFASNRPRDNSEDFGNTCCNDLFQINFKKKPIKDEHDSREFTSLKELQMALPVTLYFHNDEPNPRSVDTTTTVNYADAYDSYLRLIPRYLGENSKGLSGTKKEEAEQITQDFFDLRVKKGMSDLEIFSDLLLPELESGKSIRLVVRGFASPRAKSDYNLKLTRRRTMSLINYLRMAKGGKFAPYFDHKSGNGAILVVEQLPFGEYKADRGVSDDLVDVKNSIYSRNASLERKIEIESIELIETKGPSSSLIIPEEQFNFGKIGKYNKVYHTFYLENSNNRPMVIDSVVASCGCTEPVLPKYTIEPGEKLPMEVGFDPFGKRGVDEKYVMIYVQGEEPRRIVIRAEVTDQK